MRKYLPVIVLSIFLLLLLIGINEKKKGHLIETFSVSAKTEEDIEDELIIALFIEDIRNEVTSFYSEYYSGMIMVYNYETVILELEKNDNNRFTIRFGVTPQIGAHNPLGYDELQYLVDSEGNKILTEYQHVKSFTIPDRFEQYIIRKIE